MRNRSLAPVLAGCLALTGCHSGSQEKPEKTQNAFCLAIVLELEGSNLQGGKDFRAAVVAAHWGNIALQSVQFTYNDGEQSTTYPSLPVGDLPTTLSLGPDKNDAVTVAAVLTDDLGKVAPVHQQAQTFDKMKRVRPPTIPPSTSSA